MTGRMRNRVWIHLPASVIAGGLFLFSLSLSPSPAPPLEEESELLTLPELTTLQFGDPGVKALREQIARNLKATARGEPLSEGVHLYRYQVRKEDNFYTIMARLSLDEDTLSSLNGLVNPADLSPGEWLLVPDARGLFVRGESREHAVQGREFPGERAVPLGESWFLPGQKYTPRERALFRGNGFFPPLQRIRITSGFGNRRDPFTNRATFHGGVDLGAPPGTPVRASRGGVIKRSGWRGAYGNLVVIDHGHGYQTYYGHLSRILVKQGERVKAGQLIGRVGKTGRATGPHLHFEVRRDGRRTRPRLLHGVALSP